ncbi:MAG: DUF4136 domain-containing protein [Alloacidobacterium sp.]|jgi:hypothetical protein
MEKADGRGMGGITPEQNVIGTMIVDLYDAKTKSLVWRGIGQDTLNNNGNKNQQIVEKAVFRRCSSNGRSEPVAATAGKLATEPLLANSDYERAITMFGR